MSANFFATVSALTYSFIFEQERGRVVAGCHRNAVVRFIVEQQARMPDYLRLPLHGATLLFDAVSFFFTGRLFHRLPHARRWPIILRWKHSGIGPCADLMRFYESLAVFGWSSMRHEQ